MKPSLACVGLGPAQFAIIGLLYPTALDNGESWTMAERETMRRGAWEIWGRWPSEPQAIWDHLPSAQIVVNSHSPTWWPYAYVNGGLDGGSVENPIDISLPVLWGAEWLYLRIEPMSGAGRNGALASLDEVMAVCRSRIQRLRDDADTSQITDDLPSLIDACAAASRAISRFGPVLLFPAF